MAWFADADHFFPAISKTADELSYELKESGDNDMRRRGYTTLKTPAAET